MSHDENGPAGPFFPWRAAMSGRAIRRSYRMVQGFGVQTFRLVNARGESRSDPPRV